MCLELAVTGIEAVPSVVLLWMLQRRILEVTDSGGDLDAEGYRPRDGPSSDTGSSSSDESLDKVSEAESCHVRGGLRVAHNGAGILFEGRLRSLES